MVMLTAVGNNGAVYAIEKDRYFLLGLRLLFYRSGVV